MNSIININSLKERLKQIILDLEKLDDLISNNSLEHEQFVLDFYDKLNEISIRK